MIETYYLRLDGAAVAAALSAIELYRHTTTGAWYEIPRFAPKVISQADMEPCGVALQMVCDHYRRVGRVTETTGVAEFEAAAASMNYALEHSCVDDDGRHLLEISDVQRHILLRVLDHLGRIAMGQWERIPDLAHSVPVSFDSDIDQRCVEARRLFTCEPTLAGVGAGSGLGIARTHAESRIATDLYRILGGGTSDRRNMRHADAVAFVEPNPWNEFDATNNRNRSTDF